MKTLKTLITGGFRPPGKQIVQFLPAGAQLTLKPEYDNPYDDGAIQVFCSGSAVPQDLWPQADDSMTGTGFDMAELAVAEICLGYVARTGGRPLAGTSLPGNAEFKPIVDSGQAYSCTLAFAPDGKPMVALATETPNDDSTRSDGT